jgi:hypothetical protein
MTRPTLSQEQIEAELATFKPPRLPKAAAATLRARLRDLLRNVPEPIFEAFYIELDEYVAHFCQWERRATGRRPSKIKRELRQLARRIDSLSAALRRLSDAARDEVDSLIWPGFEMPENFLDAERPFIPRNPYIQATQKKPARPKSRKAAPQSTYYVDPVVITLARLREAINDTLSQNSRGGAPLRLPWHHLAWEVARAIGQHLNTKLSTKSGGLFEEILRGCLDVGLKSIRSKTLVPDDLRSYTRSALKRLKHSAADIKPSQK